MKPEVEQALADAARIRRSLLTGLSPSDRKRLLESLFIDFFVEQWRVLVKWGALTGQSTQVDTGYIAQHIASIILGEPGQGFKGKGKDLMDDTEVKSAAILSGVDRPRWNHNLGSLDSDRKRQLRNQAPTWQQYLAAPRIFYLLFDRVETMAPAEKVLRVRCWCVDVQLDGAWRSLITKFINSRTGDTYNLQLHPPVGYDDSIVVNTLGNLDMANVKVLDVRIHGLASPDGQLTTEWMVEPPDDLRSMTGQCVSLPYGSRSDRPSRLNKAADMLPDLRILRELLPGADLDQVLAALEIELALPDDQLSDQ